ncbi:class I SAM-dependent methyltransferase [Cognatilysobacter bugurensis]|uniref:Methyltransferase n=1 Tax=Cognatilysobacter bugurensis TaxID=543356 RepID=A0A918T2P0_9GAMM|nr:methyltransferase [Lysobacter bugurensis]
MNRLLLATLVPALLAACASTQDSPTNTASAAEANAAATASAPASASAVDTAALDAAIAGDWRSAENRARDAHRHPRETLAFFGVEPDDTVIEITPGGGWYSEVLAPYLARGQYVAAVVDPASQSNEKARAYYTKANDGLTAKLTGDAARFGGARTVKFDPKQPNFGAPGSADVVLTFRNVHNWRMDGNAEAMFKGFYDVLKSGGTLGVVEHRAAADVPADDKSGYVGQAQVIALAKAAGFELAAQSEVNANPRDTKNHPNGVWTLPPAKRHEAADAAKYEAIGESDRMTLRFRKP